MRFLLGAITTIGLVASVATFWPRITVDSIAQLDPLNPYPIPFTIMNTGFLPLMNVHVNISICQLDFREDKDSEEPDDAKICDGSLLTSFGVKKWYIARLGMDEQNTIMLDDPIKVQSPVKWKMADISIIIYYEPWLLHIQRKKEFRFVTRREIDGKMSWLSRPLHQFK